MGSQRKLSRKDCVICMYKIGVIGDYDSICGFSALGLDIYSVSTAEEAENILKKLAETEYGIIYVTENYMEKMKKTVEKFAKKQVPAIIAIPSNKGSSGYGLAGVKKYVEQAVGSDVIFNDN